MANETKSQPTGSANGPLEPTTREHGEWGYTDQAVSGFGEDYDAQVAHGSESELPSASPEDDALAGAVRKNLAHAHIDAADLRIQVSAARVTLYGSVRHDFEKSQLEARARAVPGVVSVVSRLSVA
jgi:hypothetical protein